MDDMIADIGMEYDLGSGDQYPPSEVHNFYRLLAASDEKVHNDTDLTVLQAVTCLVGMTHCYDINGYSFQMTKLEVTRPLIATANNGVVISDEDATSHVTDYYGIL
jgi:hypothetical protein